MGVQLKSGHATAHPRISRARHRAEKGSHTVRAAGKLSLRDFLVSDQRLEVPDEQYATVFRS